MPFWNAYYKLISAPTHENSWFAEMMRLMPHATSFIDAISFAAAFDIDDFARP